MRQLVYSTILSGVAYALVLLATSSASAYDWEISDAKVNIVEGTYVPNNISFQIEKSSPGGSCPSGQWLNWFGQGTTDQLKRENVKGVFALLLAAKVTGTTVTIYGNNNSNCTIDFIHLR